MEQLFTEGSDSSWDDGSGREHSSESGCDLGSQGSVSAGSGCEEGSTTSDFVHSAPEACHSSQVSVCGPDHDGEEVSVQGDLRDDVLQETSTERGSVVDGPWNPSRHKCEYPAQWTRDDGSIRHARRKEARQYLAFHRSLYHIQNGAEYIVHSDEERIRPVYPPCLPWITPRQANMIYCQYDILAIIVN